MNKKGAPVVHSFWFLFCLFSFPFFCCLCVQRLSVEKLHHVHRCGLRRSVLRVLDFQFLTFVSLYCGCICFLAAGGPTMATIALQCPEYKVNCVDLSQKVVDAWNSDCLPMCVLCCVVFCHCFLLVSCFSFIFFVLPF